MANNFKGNLKFKCIAIYADTEIFLLETGDETYKWHFDNLKSNPDELLPGSLEEALEKLLEPGYFLLNSRDRI